MIRKHKTSKRASQKTPSIRATVSIPYEMYRIVEAMADEKRVSFAWVVRDALEKYVAERWPLLSKDP
jgi:hypothetical protein